MNDIYLKIKSVRLKKNLTQEEVSKGLGMAQSNYARMERGLSQITVERLEELAKIFEMTPEALMTFSEDQGDFKEDAQFYYGQVKKLEAKVKKLEKEAEDREEVDSDFYSNKEAEKRKLITKVADLKRDLASKDMVINERQVTIEKLENEILEKNKFIEHLQNANTKLLEIMSKFGE